MKRLYLSLLLLVVSVRLCWGQTAADGGAGFTTSGTSGEVTAETLIGRNQNALSPPAPNFLDVRSNNNALVTVPTPQGGHCYLVDTDTSGGDAYHLMCSASTSKGVTVDGSLSVQGPRPWYDVRAYGAIGNGSTDDTAAIQAAIDANGTAGSVIFFPCGTYLISSTLTVPYNSHELRGANPFCATLKTSADTTMLQIGGASPVSGNTVRNLGFLTTNGAPTAATVGVELKSSGQGLVDNLYFRGINQGVLIQPDASYNTIQHLNNFGGAPLMADMVTINGAGPLLADNAAFNTIQDIVAAEVTHAGVYAHGVAFGDMHIHNARIAASSATACVYLNATTPGGGQLYADHITISGLDCDGTATAGVTANNILNLTVFMTNGGGIPTPFTGTGNTNLNLITNSTNGVVQMSTMGVMGIGVQAPAASAALDITSTTGALLVPRMTSTQRDNLSATDGMIIMCVSGTDAPTCATPVMQIRANGAWKSL